MKRPLLILALFGLGVLLGHRWYLYSYPFAKAQETLEIITEGTLQMYRWFYVPKLDGSHRKIRRVSSDVLYAYCLFDLSEGDLSVSLAPWGRFQSAAIFGMNSDHYLTYRSLSGEELRFVLRRAELPFARGFVMMRRLSHGKINHRLQDDCRKL